jgi:type III secretion protein D
MLKTPPRSTGGGALRRLEGAPLLAVVSGPRTGARRALVPGRRTTIGYDLECDVVIRHPSLQGMRASVSIDGEEVRLHVDQGQVSLLGLVVPAGRSLILPRWVPFGLGDAMLAVGSEEGRGWANCRRLAHHLAEERAIDPAEEPAGAGQAGDDPAPLLDARGRLDPVDRKAAGALSASWRGKGGGSASRALLWQVPAVMAVMLVLGLAVAMLTPMVNADSSPTGAQSLDRVRTALADRGLVALRVETSADGTPVVRGFVDTDAQRAQISGEVSRLGVRAYVELVSGEQLVRQVGDVFRMKGLSARVQHLGRGVVEAHLAEAEPDRVRRAEDAVRRDVPGLAGLKVQFAPKAPVASADRPSRFSEDPAKRVVSVAYGPHGHVVTADGARYFVGALLPSGHRIVRIHEGEVELLRDGQTTRLAL